MTSIPKCTAGWLFLCIILLAISLSFLFTIALENVVAVTEHEVLLNGLPEKVRVINDNIIRLCSVADIQCVP